MPKADMPAQDRGAREMHIQKYFAISLSIFI
jgi:hypothetical protein